MKFRPAAPPLAKPNQGRSEIFIFRKSRFDPTSHPPLPRTPELLAEEALKHSSRADFCRKSPNAYAAARRLGVLDDVTGHLEYLDTYNTRDVVYLWFAEADIYKVGVTSENLGDQRIHDVAKDAGFMAEIIVLENVGTVRAKQIESQLLKIGKPVSLIRSFPGASEFRHFSSDDLVKAIELILAG